MYPVTRIDPLGRIANLPVHAALQAGFLLNNGHTDILGYTGIHGGFKDHNGAGGQILAHRAGGALHRTQIRCGIRVHRGRHRHNDKLGFLQPGGVGGKIHRGVPDGGADLIGGIDAVSILVDPFFVDVKTDNGNVLGKLYGNGHAHIAQAHQCQLFLTGNQAGINVVEFHMATLLLKPPVLRHTGG